MPIAIKSVKTIILCTFKILRLYVLILFDRRDGQTWWTYVTDRRDGQIWRTDMTDWRDGQTWRTDVKNGRNLRMERCDGRTWRTDVTDGFDRRTWWTDVTDGRDERTFCSHVYLFKKVRTLFVVRTFYNIRERIIRLYSCSHLFVRTSVREWKP